MSTSKNQALNISEEDLNLHLDDLNEDPELTSGASGTVVENLPDTTVVYTATASDQDAGHDGNIQFSITSDATDDSDKVSIDASTGVVTLVDSADFENQAGEATLRFARIPPTRHIGQFEVESYACPDDIFIEVHRSAQRSASVRQI